MSEPSASIDPRRVEYLALDELSPDPRNPKAHESQIIDASIGRFGMLDPIVKDERTGHIISGHGRQKALTAMHARGETPPEGVTVDGAGRWLVPVVTGWASRSDTEAAAALIALNRTTELGGWVDDTLLGLLDELSAVDGGLVGVGYDEDELETLRALVEGIGGEEFDFSDLDGDGVEPTGGSEQHGITVTCPECDHTFEV